MPKNGPIIIIEDDMDDQEMLREVFKELKLPNLVHVFDSCVNALDYLLTTIERPLLILSDINLPLMTGMELKQEINNTDYLKRKSIPFVFLSTASDSSIVSTAFEVQAQGFFVKPRTMDSLKNTIRTIIDYWKCSSLPTAV
jgi:two-component SAPR family response regulator